MRKKISLFMLAIFTSSCSTNDVSGFSVNNYKDNSYSIPNPSASKSLTQKEMEDLAKFTPPSNTPIIGNNTVISPNKNNEPDGFTYDAGIPDSVPESTTILNVIFKNSYKVRVEKENKKVSSINARQKDLLNNILTKYKVISVGDLRLNEETEEKMNKDETEFNNKKLKSEFPNFMSIHRYEFPKETNFKALLSELKNIEGIREAYAEGIYTNTATTQLLARQAGPVSTSSTFPYYNNIPPAGEPGFTSYPEYQAYIPPPAEPNPNWYHFRRHRVFEAWGLASVNKATMAIIDSGFDVGNLAIDKPNYLNTGFSIEPAYPNNYNKNNGTSYTQATNDAHGATVASVAGSPINGQFFCGVDPSVPIVPVKVPSFIDSNNNSDNYAYYLSQAIRHLADDTVNNVDVINISLALVAYGVANKQFPLTSNSTLKSAISYAIGKGKVLVIGAGNYALNLDDNNIYTGTTYQKAETMEGLLIVGGSEYDNGILSGSQYINATGRNVAWQTDDTPGVNNDNISSNYGSAIDITASAYRIGSVKYNPSTNTRWYTSATGTSFAAPMVSAAAGLVKKAYTGPTNLTPAQIKSILVGTANLGRYNKGYGNDSTSYNLLGQGLNIISKNPYTAARIRDLNIFNALIVSKNINNYQAITRIFNGDDNIEARVGASSPYAYQQYAEDSLYGINGLNSGALLNFKTYNNTGGYAYGYQVYNGSSKTLVGERFDGIAGVHGAQNNLSAANNSWYAQSSFTY